MRENQDECTTQLTTSQSCRQLLLKPGALHECWRPFPAPHSFFTGPPRFSLPDMLRPEHDFVSRIPGIHEVIVIDILTRPRVGIVDAVAPLAALIHQEGT